MEEGEPENQKKNPHVKARTIIKLNQHMTLGWGIEPGPPWWEASALTTAPSLLLLGFFWGLTEQESKGISGNRGTCNSFREHGNKTL